MIQGKEYSRVLQAGRRKAYFLGFKRRDKVLLSLKDLTDVVKPRDEQYVGSKEVPVSRIIGTEDRGSDFAESFLPTKSHMEHRWNKVRDLMLGPGIGELIKVVEYGGHYFVRDGNHRVSVAKTHGVEFLDAEIIRYSIPVSLPADMRYSKIPMFKEKADFQDKTKFFDHVSEETLGEGHPETWRMLADRILPSYGERLKTKIGRDAEPGEMEKDFTEGALTTVMNIVRRRALPWLFPGQFDLDIGCRLMDSFDLGADSEPPIEAMLRYLKSYRRRHPLQTVAQAVIVQLKTWTATAQSEREVFYQMTRLRVFCPEAEIPEGRRGWYRFLTRQVIISYSSRVSQGDGKPLMLDEIVRKWYTELFRPAWKLHQDHQIQVPFPIFYMGWAKFNRKEAASRPDESGPISEASIRQSFEDYRKKSGL